MLNVDVSVDNWLPNVHEKEHWHQWEHQSDPVSSETNVNLSISLEGGEWVPVSLVGGLSSEGDLFLPETLDILVNSALDLWLHLVSLDHLDDLLLLLVDGGVLSADLLETLVDIVVESTTHFLINK